MEVTVNLQVESSQLVLENVLDRGMLLYVLLYSVKITRAIKSEMPNSEFKFSKKDSIQVH